MWASACGLKADGACGWGRQGGAVREGTATGFLSFEVKMF